MADRIVVDIRTRFIPDEQRCFILFPGDGYRFYPEISRESAIFLDIPGFPLNEGEDLRNVKDLTKRVVVSSRIAKWHRDGRPADKVPARTTAELSHFRETTAQQQFAGMVRGFFHQIKAGDIIIVPPSSYEEDVLFGEVLDGPFVSVAVPHYPDEEIPARKVKWLSKLPREKIPSWLERKIPSPNPLRQIERTFFEDIFDIMYERYFFNGRFVCKFNVSSKEFSALDNFLFQQIVLYVAALHENRHEGNISNIGQKPISTVVSELEFSEDIPDQRIFINSPGHIVVYSKNLIPVVAAVMMTLSASSIIVQDAANAQIVIENSADKSQISRECIGDVEAEVTDDLNAMGYARWRELCAIETQARQRTQISTGMAAEPANTAPKIDRPQK